MSEFRKLPDNSRDLRCQFLRFLRPQEAEQGDIAVRSAAVPLLPVLRQAALPLAATVLALCKSEGRRFDKPAGRG